MDSDFSIDEDDEPVSDHGDEEGSKRRRVTKAYREPSTKKPKPTVKPRENKPKPKPSRKARRTSGRSTYTVMDSGRDNLIYYLGIFYKTYSSIVCCKCYFFFLLILHAFIWKFY